jgi:S-DNA-T family DNA segregation ATPase FtsK/SpoIIIE
MGGLFGDTALGVILTVLPLGGALVGLLVWTGTLLLGLFALGVTRAEIAAARQRVLLTMVLGYAGTLRMGARGLLVGLDAVERTRGRARSAMEERAARVAAEKARLAEEEAALRLVPDPERPQRLMPGTPPASTRAAILRPQASEAPRGVVMPPPPRPDPGRPGARLGRRGGGRGGLGRLARPDEVEAELWAAPAPLGIPPAPAFLATPAPDHLPIPAAKGPGLLSSFLRRGRAPEPAPAFEEEDEDDMPPLVHDERLRDVIGEAIRQRREAPPLRAEPVVDGLAARRALPEAPVAAPALRAEAAVPLRAEGSASPVLRAPPAARPAPRQEAPAARPAPRPAAASVRPTPKPPAHPGYEPPPLDLLSDPAEVQRHHLSDTALEENARALERVLDDFGVKGEIVSVRPGPWSPCTSSSPRRDSRPAA